MQSLPSNQYPAEARIKKRADFLIVQKEGKKVHGKHFLILWHPSLRPASHSPRLGITVTTKTEKLSPRRNRVKRLLREIFRTEIRHQLPLLDLVVIVRPGAADLSYEETRTEILQLLHRARI